MCVSIYMYIHINYPLNNVYVVGSSISVLRTGKWIIASQIRSVCPVGPRWPPRFHKKNCFEEKIAQEELLRGGKFLNLPKPNFPLWGFGVFVAW